MQSCEIAACLAGESFSGTDQAYREFRVVALSADSSWRNEGDTCDECKVLVFKEDPVAHISFRYEAERIRTRRLTLGQNRVRQRTCPGVEQIVQEAEGRSRYLIEPKTPPLVSCPKSSCLSWLCKTGPGIAFRTCSAATKMNYRLCHKLEPCAQ